MCLMAFVHDSRALETVYCIVKREQLGAVVHTIGELFRFALLQRKSITSIKPGGGGRLGPRALQQ